MTDDQTKKATEASVIYTQIDKCRRKADWYRDRAEDLRNLYNAGPPSDFGWHTDGLIHKMRSKARDLEEEAERLGESLVRLFNQSSNKP